MRKVNWNERVKVGMKFNSLTIVEVPNELSSISKIHCRCDCGNEKYIRLENLLSGNTKSCGCLKSITSKINMKKAASAPKPKNRSVVFNGESYTKYGKIVKFFNHMHVRSNTDHYKNKGISISSEWSYTSEGYNNFKTWLLSELDKMNISLDDFNKFHHGELSLDRIDNDKGYYPSNCRLATRKQQSRNRDCSWKFLGKHIFDYSDELGIPYKLAIEYYFKNEFGKLLDYYNQ